MSRHINIIAIVARDGAIGVRGDQPFHISDDFRRFKSLTLNHPIIMGRKTFEALPKGALPGRRNIVITRDTSWTAPDTERVSSLEDAIATASDSDEIFIIGGGSVYTQALSVASRLYLTEVDADVPDADTYFPAIDPGLWEKTESLPTATDTRSGVNYRFTTYSRKG
ncbi:MAG: dihydrofolate reductase [Paramuribaculum sp.]|nr:dihydrofolate reductase [Paramuribaculum sp.]